jgi:PucR family transcriptional regulator, purine catabolism regulatory protein
LLTLQDVLDQADLGLELLAGDARARARAVAGAHSMEVGRPLEWLDKGWVMLTIGMRLQGSPREQRQLVADAAEGGLAALGFGVGLVFDEVPAPMLDEARRRNFPIFTVPVELPFRAIVDFVNRSLLSGHMLTMQRTLSIQRYLMDTLSQPEPREDLLTRLAQVLQCSVMLYRHDGRLLLARGASDHEAIWQEICLREPREQDFSLSGISVRSSPVLIEGAPIEWLIVALPERRVETVLVREVFRSACKILGIIGQARRVAVAEERQARTQLLGRLLTAPPEGADIDRLRVFGIDIASGARVVVLETMSAAEGTNGELEARVERKLADAHVPFLLTWHDARLVILAQGHELDREWVAEVSADGIPTRAGAGRLIHRADEVAASHNDARIALSRLARAGAGGFVRIEDLDFAEWLVTGAAPGQLSKRADQTLGNLRAHQEMYDTLVAYLRADLNVKVAAQRLHLHPNSLRYRLGRIEQLLDRRLDEVPAIVDLYLALLIDGSSAAPNGHASLGVPQAVDGEAGGPAD